LTENKEHLILRAGSQLKDNLFNLRRINKVLLNELKSDTKIYSAFILDISDKWKEFQNKNEQRKIKYRYTTFFHRNFDYFFRQSIDNLFGFDSKNLKLVLRENVTDNDLYFEYKLYFSEDEMNLIAKFKERVSHPLEYDRIIPFIFEILIRILGMIIRETINKKIWISQNGARLKKKEKKSYLHFLITIRRSPDEIMDGYLAFVLYNFAIRHSEIPDSYKKTLLERKNLLTKIALKNYTIAKYQLVDIIFTFFKKCTLLENVSPFLDFLNFVCSRVEDSIFDTIEIIKEDFLSNLDYPPEVNESLIQIFNFINKYSTLFSTFQANNRPSFRNQYELFLLYLQFYFGRTLESLEISDLLFFPKRFGDLIKEHNLSKKDKISFKTIRSIGYFSNIALSLSHLPGIEDFFYKLLNKKKIQYINEIFFMTFLKSLNEKFLSLIEEENIKLKKSQNKISFEKAIDFICRSLYSLINKVFLRENVEDASKSFLDPRSRYIPENVATRVLELSIFKDLNLSDDIWPDYFLSINKEEVKNLFKKYFEIPEDVFYSDWSLSMIDMIYNQELFHNEKYLEVFLIEDVVIPLNKFFLQFEKKKESIENKDDLLNDLTKIITKQKWKKEDTKRIFSNIIELWDLSF